MSLATIVRKASVEAQGLLAQIQGTSGPTVPNFLYGMETGIGVFGAATVVEVPQPSGGYRRRAQVPLTVTRDQSFTFEPKTKIVRLSTSVQFPAITYVIDFIDVHDPLIWTLILVKNGPAS